VKVTLCERAPCARALPSGFAVPYHFSICFQTGNVFHVEHARHLALKELKQQQQTAICFKDLTQFLLTIS